MKRHQYHLRRSTNRSLALVFAQVACSSTNELPSYYDAPETVAPAVDPAGSIQPKPPPPLPPECSTPPVVVEVAAPTPVDASAFGVDLAELPVGWASVDPPATGGYPDAEPTRVTSFDDLSALVGSPDPSIVLLAGHVSGALRVQSNTTLIGAPGATISGSISLDGVENVVIRNLTIRGRNCEDSPTDCSGGSDAVSVRNSHHVWFDHLNVFDGSDGNLDITHASDFVTVSWSKFWYCDPSRDHRFSNLIGASDESPEDVGRLRVTFHHNWWTNNVQQRMPRTRYGQIHLFNNLYDSETSDYCANAGYQAAVLLEQNVFHHVHSPHTVSSGNLLSLHNVYEGTDGDRAETGTAFEPPYSYTPDPADVVQERVREGAGPID